MKSTLLKFAKWGGIAFGVLFALGVVISIVDPEGVKRREAERQAAQKQSASESKGVGSKKTKVDPVWKHGYAVGFVSAKSGAVKPTADELDAHARRAAQELGEQGGMGFKMQWKNGFWAGWSKGD